MKLVETGVFKIIANDGKADRMIMATELLNQRIKEIMCLRKQQGFPDPSPTLVDIERTHVLFVNAHFKPFAALGFEYNKCRTSSGVPQFGSTVQFSIPQFGDFFSDMVIHTTLAATKASVGTVPVFPPLPLGALAVPGVPSTATAQISGIPNFPDTQTFTQYTQEYVTADGTPIAPGTAGVSNYIRYAEYPGERLFKQVSFEVNGNPLDQYTAEAMFFHRKFRLSPNKVIGWKRLVGQEVPIEAYTDLESFAPYQPLAGPLVQGASPWNLANLNLQGSTGAGVVGAPVSPAITARKFMSVVTGYQTPQFQQPALDLWIPLIFWFNRDSRLSIPSISIPYGQRFITVNLEQQANILFTAPGNLFMRLTVEEQVTADVASGGLATAIAVNRVTKYVTETPVLAVNSNIDTNQQFGVMELYINNIFMNPEIHDIYIRRIGFSLIRVYRQQVNREAVSADSVLLSQLKWPVEYLFVGMRPTFNIAATNPNQYRDWHRLTLQSDNVLETVSQSSSTVMIDNAAAFNTATPLQKKVSLSRESVEKLYFPSSSLTVDTLQIQAHGINIFDVIGQAFFRDYECWTFGGANINTPEDEGAYLINFCLYPGTYQPSGHINVSRAREFHLNFTSSYVSTSSPADLIVVATAINFLLISDGSAVLRYST